MPFRYDIAIEPNPLNIQQKGAINLQLDVELGPVFCQKFYLTTQYGVAVDALFESPPNFSCTSPAWQSSDVKEPGTPAARLYTPSDGCDSVEVTKPFSFVVTGTISDHIGKAKIIVSSWTSKTKDGPFERSETYLTFTKTEYKFYVRRFAAADPDSPSEPATRFKRDAPIDLSWESTGTSFQVYVNNKASGWQDSKAFRVNALKCDTTIFLAAKSKDGDILYDALTLTIADPELKTLGVSDTLTVTKSSSVTADRDFQGATITEAGDITATGKVKSGSIACTGEISAAGHITTQGDLITPGVVSAGKIKVAEITTDVVFKGKVTFEGDVTFGGDVKFNKNVTCQGAATFSQRVSLTGNTNLVFNNRWSLFTVPQNNYFYFMDANQQQVVIKEQGRIEASGSTSARYFHDGDWCIIQSMNRQANLNATEKFPTGQKPDSWKASTYWKSWNHPDSDVNMKLVWLAPQSSETTDG